MPCDTEWIAYDYIAGLFDGEGSLGIYRSRTGGWGYKLSITNTNRAVLESIQEQVGAGTISAQRKKANMTVYSLGLCNKGDIARFLAPLQLLIKAGQAAVMLGCIRKQVPPAAASKELKRLKKCQ